MKRVAAIVAGLLLVGGSAVVAQDEAYPPGTIVLAVGVWDGTTVQDAGILACQPLQVSAEPEPSKTPTPYRPDTNA